jgi:hypothetical protein
MLEQRALYFPVRFGSATLARRVLAVAADLAQNDFLGAERRLVDLDRALADDAEPPAHLATPVVGDRVTPTLRARVLARILRDLATHGWTVMLEAGQVYVRAPSQLASGASLTQEEVRAEKDRARAHVAARVQEQLLRPAMRRFIASQETLHFGGDGPRSVRSLVADGPSLAAALRQHGAPAIRPYLQVASAEKDEHTGLRLWDVYRYFRHFWSFPFYSTPGRTLPILVRDAGQPNHPVCGLLCLASPVPKLGVRDTALGLTPAWLEAILVGVEGACSSDPRAALNDLSAQLDAAGDASLTTAQVWSDLHRLLRLTGPATLPSLVSQLKSMTRGGRAARAVAARRRLVSDLLAELADGVRGIGVADLGLTHSQLLRSPDRFIEDLRDHSISARRAWKGSRSLTSKRPARVRRDSENMSGAELKDFSRDPLFLKKRVAQLASLLTAWSELAPLRRSADAATVRDHILGERSDWTCLTGGSRVAGGLRCALQQRLSRLMAAQVADVSVCGALPPYGPLLGGKLAALMALSGELAALYFAQYDGQISDIKSKMAGRAFRRPADLLALTTTSFFSIGSSQYNRVRLPESMGGACWRHIGQSAGHGTMHFSLETTELIQSLLKVETGQALITSEFGEGPSERMRKVRDGLVRLGLPADELLRHGTPRLVYLAELNAGESKPGLSSRGAAWRRCGPTGEAVAAFWRERWLAPRLVRKPELLTVLEGFRREDVLLSKRLDAADGGLALVSGGEG